MKSKHPLHDVMGRDWAFLFVCREVRLTEGAGLSVFCPKVHIHSSTIRKGCNQNKTLWQARLLSKVSGFIEGRDGRRSIMTIVLTVVGMD